MSMNKIYYDNNDILFIKKIKTKRTKINETNQNHNKIRFRQRIVSKEKPNRKKTPRSTRAEFSVRNANYKMLHNILSIY